MLSHCGFPKADCSFPINRCVSQGASCAQQVHKAVQRRTVINKELFPGLCTWIASCQVELLVGAVLIICDEQRVQNCGEQLNHIQLALIAVIAVLLNLTCAGFDMNFVVFASSKGDSDKHVTTAIFCKVFVESHQISGEHSQRRHWLQQCKVFQCLCFVRLGLTFLHCFAAHSAE